MDPKNLEKMKEGGVINADIVSSKLAPEQMSEEMRNKIEARWSSVDAKEQREAFDAIYKNLTKNEQDYFNDSLDKLSFGNEARKKMVSLILMPIFNQLKDDRETYNGLLSTYSDFVDSSQTVRGDIAKHYETYNEGIGEWLRYLGAADKYDINTNPDYQYLSRYYPEKWDGGLDNRIKNFSTSYGIDYKSLERVEGGQWLYNLANPSFSFDWNVDGRDDVKDDIKSFGSLFFNKILSSFAVKHGYKLDKSVSSEVIVDHIFGNKTKGIARDENFDKAFEKFFGIMTDLLGCNGATPMEIEKIQNSLKERCYFKENIMDLIDAIQGVETYTTIHGDQSIY